MPIGPRPQDVPRIRTAVKVYKVSSIITGTFLLLLVLMMVLRYIIGVDIELNPVYGLQLTPKELITGVNISTLILIVHGWMYVLYLGTDFVLWRSIRWSFGKFLFIALGGVIPLRSFFLERRVPREALATIAHLEKTEPSVKAAA
jgi:integral membrane protein